MNYLIPDPYRSEDVYAESDTYASTTIASYAGGEVDDVYSRSSHGIDRENDENRSQTSKPREAYYYSQHEEGFRGYGRRTRGGKTIFQDGRQSRGYSYFSALKLLLRNGAKFPCLVRILPSTVGSCNRLLSCGIPSDWLENNIRSARAVIHKDCLDLISKFLNHKLQYGSRVEQHLYAGMGIHRLVGRLIMKKPVKFTGLNDDCILQDDTIRKGGWEEVGTDNQRPPLVLEDYMSSDEMKLASLITFSTHTELINEGGRNNSGIPGKPGHFEERGVISRLSGPFVNRGMGVEWPGVIDDTKWVHPDLQRILHEFCYNQRVVTPTQGLPGVNIPAFLRRIHIMIQSLLLDADDRAVRSCTTAVVLVTGLQLGVCKLHPNQTQWFCEILVATAQDLDLCHLTDIYLNWISLEGYASLRDGDIIPGTKIRSGDKIPDTNITIHIHTEDRPYAKLPQRGSTTRSRHGSIDTATQDYPFTNLPPTNGKKVVPSYSGNANSLSGIEHWKGQLDTTEILTCSTQAVSEPIVNNDVLKALYIGLLLLVLSLLFCGVNCLHKYCPA